MHTPSFEILSFKRDHSFSSCHANPLPSYKQMLQLLTFHILSRTLKPFNPIDCSKKTHKPHNRNPQKAALQVTKDSLFFVLNIHYVQIILDFSDFIFCPLLISLTFFLDDHTILLLPSQTFFWEAASCGLRLGSSFTALAGLENLSAPLYPAT